MDGLWERVLDVLGWVALFVAALKGLQYIFSLLPSSKLALQVKENTEKLQKDYTRLDKLNERLDSLEQRINESEKERAEETRLINQSLNMLGKSQISMLRHFVDGNGIEEMKREAEKLTSFFIDKTDN